MENRDIVRIVNSDELSEMKLMPISGRIGRVVEVRINGKGNVFGAWVELFGKPYLDEQEWFIPIKSITEYELDRFCYNTLLSNKRRAKL